jgi:hypothetical protein
MRIRSIDRRMDVPRSFSASQAPQRLEKRLASLRTLEWVNIAWLAVLLLWWAPGWQQAPVPTGTWQRTLAFLPVAGLLAVGGWYWHRKLQQLRDGRSLEDAMPVLHRAGRYARRALTALTVAMAVSWVAGVGGTADRAWATLLILFAWAEYLNYFHVQLMHDTRSDLARLARTRRLRPSWLASDLAAWQESSSSP